MRTVSFNKFDGGMVNDPRDPREDVSRTSQNFDVFTDKYRLTPYRDSESGDSAATTNLIKNFAYDGTTIYGRGDTGSNTVEVLTKTDFTNATWSALIAPGVSNTNSTRDAAFFTYYPSTGKLYGVGHLSRYVWSVTVSGPSAVQQAADLTAYSNVSNGLVHSKDDMLYFGYDNKIARNNADSWTVAALTLPTDCIITSICEYGNFLAIGCRRTSGLKSTVYLWDRDSTLATLPEVIDWQEGDLRVLEELEGSLIGVSYVGSSVSNTGSRTIFRHYSSANGAEEFAKFVGTTVFATAYVHKRKTYNRIVFSSGIYIGSTIYFGIWEIARNSTGLPFGVTLGRFLNNNSNIGSSVIPYGLIVIGDYTFASYLDNSAVFRMDKTDDQAAYTSTSIYETTINPIQPERYRLGAGTRSSLKQLVAAALGMQPLTSGQQAVLKFRVDGGSWVTVLTASAVGKTVQESAFDSTGKPFQNGREFEFRIESTGGAVITELKYKHEELNTLV